MSARLEAWVRGEEAWERRGRNPRLIDNDPNFTLGVTLPTRANTGLAARGVSEAQLSNYSGSFTNVTEGEKLDRLLISSQFNPSQACILSESKVVGPATAPPLGSTYNLVDTRRLSITSPVRIEYSTISPQVRSVDMYGFSYANHDAYRCLVEGVVDGASPMGGGVWPNTVHREAWYRGCVFTDSPFYEYDPRQTNGSHNDYIQPHGSLSILHIEGNAFGPDGEMAHATVMLGQGHGLYGIVNIIDNWCWGHPTQGAILNMSESRGAPMGNLKFWRNRISHTTNHAGSAPISIKPASRYPEWYGWQGAPLSLPSTWHSPGPNASVYMDGPNAGQPVRPKAG